MKVYITVLTGKNAQILNVFRDENEACAYAKTQSIIRKEWVTVIEKEVTK